MLLEGIEVIQDLQGGRIRWHSTEVMKKSLQNNRGVGFPVWNDFLPNLVQVPVLPQITALRPVPSRQHEVRGYVPVE